MHGNERLGGECFRSLYQQLDNQSDDEDTANTDVEKNTGCMARQNCCQRFVKFVEHSWEHHPCLTAGVAVLAAASFVGFGVGIAYAVTKCLEDREVNDVTEGESAPLREKRAEPLAKHTPTLTVMPGSGDGSDWTSWSHWIYKGKVKCTATDEDGAPVTVVDEDIYKSGYEHMGQRNHMVRQVAIPDTLSNLECKHEAVFWSGHFESAVNGEASGLNTKDIAQCSSMTAEFTGEYGNSCVRTLCNELDLSGNGRTIVKESCTPWTKTQVPHK